MMDLSEESIPTMHGSMVSFPSALLNTVDISGSKTMRLLLWALRRSSGVRVIHL